MPLRSLQRRDILEPMRSKRGGVRWGVLFCLMLAVGLAAAGYFYRDALQGSKLGSLFATKAERESGVVYYCPMHPQVQSDKPGTCPICNMNLEKMEEPGASPTGGVAESGALGTVKISLQKQQLIGIQLSEVTRGPLSSTIRAVGRLAYNETKISRIQTKLEGWIEQIFVDFTGILVKKGQPLATVYSPQLYSTQRELIVAKKSKDVLGGSSFEEVASGAVSLYEATRQRLKLWDVSDAQIREIERQGTPSRAMAIFSPISGFVVSKNVSAGQRITPETELYTVADLSSIWVMADLYEYEVSMVQLNQSAVMTLAYNPGKTYKGKVSYIYPDLDKTTRTLKVRLEFPNSDFQLKPDMYANVEIRVDHGSNLSLPREAVLDSGVDQMVFVALDNGVFEPRKVQLGARVGDRFILLDGLKAGDKVVTAGNFLVDSESQLKAAFKSMAGGSREGSGMAPAMGGEENGTQKAGGTPPPPPAHQHP